MAQIDQTVVGVASRHTRSRRSSQPGCQAQPPRSSRTALATLESAPKHDAPAPAPNAAAVFDDSDADEFEFSMDPPSRPPSSRQHHCPMPTVTLPVAAPAVATGAAAELAVDPTVTETVTTAEDAAPIVETAATPLAASGRPPRRPLCPSSRPPACLSHSVGHPSGQPRTAPTTT